MNVFKKTVTLAAAVSLVCLSSAGAMAANKLIVKDSTGVTDKFVVTDEGYVGVGKTPTVSLDVVGIPGAARLVIQTLGTSIYGGGAFIGLHNNDPAVNSGFPRQGDRIGFHLYGAKNAAGTILTGGGFQVMAEAAWSDTSLPTYFFFETAPAGSTTKVERMRITSSGNIGIGTSAPAQKLEINGGIRLNTATLRPTCSATVRGTVWFQRNAAGINDYLQVCVKDASENYLWKNIVIP